MSIVKQEKPRILVLASGGPGKDDGGSGFLEMVEYSRTDPPVLDANILVVASNHKHGGVRQKASKLGIDFVHFPGSFTEKGYRNLVEMFGADFVMCSGWLKLVEGLDPARTVNIHSGPLPRFGGPGMHGHFVHEAVMEAFHAGEIKQSAVSMHFVNENFDEGPVFFQRRVLIRSDDTPETLAKRVNEVERAWQSVILNLVVHRKIMLTRHGILYSSPDIKAMCLGGPAKEMGSLSQ